MIRVASLPLLSLTRVKEIDDEIEIVSFPNMSQSENVISNADGEQFAAVCDQSSDCESDELCY